MARILVLVLALSVSSFAQTTSPLATANQLFEKAQYAQAAAAFERLPEANKGVVIWNRLGVSYHMTNRLKEAEAAYRRAIRVDSKSGAAYNNLAALFYTQRNFGNADSQFRRAAQRNPQNATIRRNFHLSRYARENLRPARTAAEQLSKQKPALVDELTDDYLAVLSLIPANIQAEAVDHVMRADLFMVRKLYEDAVIEYRKSIALDPYDAAVLNRLGIGYLQLRKFQDAAQQFRETIRLDPYFPEAINNLGFIDYANGHYEDALGRYNRALRIEPRSASVWKNVGASYFALHRYEEASKAVQTALEIDPRLYQRVTGGGGAMIQMTEPNDPLMHFHLAKVFAGRGDKDQAMTFLYKAVDAGFDDLKTLKTEPAFALLAADERFTRLLDTMSRRSSL
jgi:Flp pilus assembly protein TadD